MLDLLAYWTRLGQFDLLINFVLNSFLKDFFKKKTVVGLIGSIPLRSKFDWHAKVGQIGLILFRPLIYGSF